MLYTEPSSLRLLAEKCRVEKTKEDKTWRSILIAVPCYLDTTLVEVGMGRLLARSAWVLAQAIFPSAGMVVLGFLPCLGWLVLSCPVVCSWSRSRSKQQHSLKSPPSSPFPPKSGAMLVMN